MHADFTLQQYIELYIRMMGYATVSVCSIFLIKMKRGNSVVLMGNVIVGAFGFFAAVDTRLNGGHLGGTLFTFAIFIWTVCNLIATLQVKK